MSEATFLKAFSMLFGTVAFLATLRFVYSYLALRQERRPELGTTALEERLARIEVAVEATAIEIERISEANRFMARLLAERSGTALPTRPERVITPH